MARRLAAALALLLLAASCGDSGKDDRAGVGTITSTTTSGGDESTSTTRDGDGPTTSRPGSSTGDGGSEGGTRPTTGRPDASTRDIIDSAANGDVGNFAGVLLAPGFADRLVLDVRVGSGAAPSESAINAMASALRTHSGKPVEIGGPVALRGAGDGTYTADQIRSLATTQGTPNRDRLAVLHVLYLPGQFEKPGTIGVAVRGDTVAIFPDEVNNASSPFGSRARIEHAVAVHELGHVLGLVDLFVDRNRDDPEHPGHSRNRGSVMFWAVETSLVGQVLGGPPPVDFDADDIADMRQIRNGAERG